MSLYLPMFQLRARDLMEPVRIRLTPETPCEQAVRELAASSAACAVVVDSAGRTIGTLDSADIMARAAFRVPGSTPVRAIMSRAVETVSEQTPLYRAIAEMQAANCHHAVVIAPDGRPLGLLPVISARVLPASLARLDKLAPSPTVSALQAARSHQQAIVRDLLHAGTPAPEIQRVIACLNDDIHRQALELARQSMEADGWGKPPVPFTLIVTGSAGRMESFLDPDQDNAMVLADYPDRDHGAVDRFFAELASRMSRHLDQVGVRFCPGHVMARNPLWRKTISQWRDQMRGWVRRRSQQSFLFSKILLDCRDVAGERSLGLELRRSMQEHFTASPSYLRALVLNESPRTVGLGWFDRIMTESDDGAHAGELDLKRYGIAPLVEAVRLYALAHDVDATTTPQRLTALADTGALTTDAADYLLRTHAFIAGLIFERQNDDATHERPLGKHITPDRLTRWQREQLVSGLKEIQGLVDRLARDLGGER